MSKIAPNVVVIPQKPELVRASSLRQERVGAYCRVSTEEEEQLNSYENQCKYYTDLIMKNPKWSLVKIYADEGISGTSTKKRDEFMRMIKDCKQKKLDLILTKSISRFSRNTVDCLHYIRLLKSWGIAVYFEKENINTLHEDSEFLITLHGAFAQQEIESLSANVNWGIQQSMRSGKARINYSNLYALRRGEDGNPEIIPERAEIVRQIYARYLAGDSLRMIRVWLESNNIQNKKGSHWTPSTIQGILTNEKYVGDVLMQKTYTVDCITHKAKKNNGERPMYLIQNNHPAIIDRETFDAVQAEMARRSALHSPSKKSPTGKSNYTSKFALSDRLYCGECGTKYRRAVWTYKGIKRPVWRCVSRMDYGKKYCHRSPTMDEEKLHQAILAGINSAMSDKRILINRITSGIEMEILPAVDYTTTIAEIDANLLDLERKFQVLLEKAAGEIASCEYMSDFQAISDEMAALKKQKASIEHSRTDGEAANRIKRAAKVLEEASAAITEWNESMIRQVVDWVKVLSADEILICLRGGVEVRQRMK